MWHSAPKQTHNERESAITSRFVELRNATMPDPEDMPNTAEKWLVERRRGEEEQLKI